MSTAPVGRILAFAFAAVIAAPLARAELPSLRPTQTLMPAFREVLPDPEGFPQQPLFASSLALERNTLLSGMPGAFDFTGRVAIFTKNAAGAWKRSGSLKASDAAPDARFGNVVALAGGRALVASDSSVYVFASQGGVWRQTQKLSFGARVRIADLDWNGSIAIVGVGMNDLGRRSNGVYAFRSTKNGKLRQIARFTAHDTAAGDLFGNRVALAGTAVAISAPGYNSDQGAVYVFTCNARGCRERQKLLSNDGRPGDGFGSAIDLHGGVLVVGAPAADSTSQQDGSTGAAYVFLRCGRDWAETQKLGAIAKESAPYGLMGFKVAVGAKRVLVTALGLPGFSPGIVLVYDWSAGALVATHALTVDRAGYGDSLVLRGRKAIVGMTDDGIPPVGFADTYTLPPDIP